MEDTFYLLANPNHYFRKPSKVNSIDDNLIILLSKKFNLKITEDNYEKNITKIETLFTDFYIDNIVKKVVDELIELTINERVLL